MKNLIVICVCLFALISCHGGDGAYVIGRRVVSPKPEKVVKLTSTDYIDGLCLEGAGGIPCVVDSIIILQLLNGSPNFFRAINIKTGTYTDFLSSGRGPNEVVAGFFSGIRKIDDRVFLDVTAINEGLLLTIDLNETLLAGSTIVSERKNLLQNSLFSYPLDGVVLSEVFGDQDLYSYKTYTSEDQKIVRMVQPFGAEEYLISYEALFNSARRIKPDGKKVSLAMFYFDEVNVFDIFGEEHLSVTVSKRNKDASVINKAIESEIWGEQVYYISQTVTNESILALYSDGSDPDSFWASSTVHAFSWDGQLKAIYHLDRPMVSIAISEDETTLYGLTEDEVLYRYDLTL